MKTKKELRKRIEEIENSRSWKARSNNDFNSIVDNQKKEMINLLNWFLEEEETYKFIRWTT